MSDRDVEAQPGDNDQTGIEGESPERPGEAKRLVMPKKADLAQSDQARRRPSRPSETATPAAAATPAASRIASLRRSTGTIKGAVTQAHPMTVRFCPDCGSECPATARECSDCGFSFAGLLAKAPLATRAARPKTATAEAQETAPEAAPIRLTAPHPLSRLRAEGHGRGSGLPFGLSGLGRLGGVGAPRLSTRRVGAGWTRRRVRIGRPSLRSLFGLAGLTATVAVVTGLIVTLPNQPSAANSAGSIYSIDWHAATKSPVAKLDFGPYFTTLDRDLLMVGTTGAGTASPTTTVWVSTDGSTWNQRSGSGAFAIEGRRFVAQGISDDGQGGLVVIGNSLGSSPTDVVASAWRSRDGSSWTPMEVDSAGGQEMVAGVASRPGAVVAAGNGVAWLSTDGRIWSPQILPGATAQGGSYTARAVGSWDGGFVIIGLWNGDGPTRSTAWYSSTGVAWTQATTSLDGFDVRGIAGLSGKIVAVGSDLSASAPGLAASWSSADGNTWTKSTAPTDQSTVAIDSVVKVGGSLLAVGAPASATTTTTSTTATASPAQPVFSGSTPPPAAVESVWVTENGVDWLPIASTTSPLNLAHAAAIGNRVVIVGGSSGGIGVISGDLVLGPARVAASQSAATNFALSVHAGNSPMIPDITKDFTLGPITTSSNRFYLFATGPTGTGIFTSGDGSLWVQEVGPGSLTASAVAQPVASSASAQAAASGAPGQPVVTGRPVVLQAIPDGQGGIIAIGKVTNSAGDNGMIWHMTKPGTWNQVQFQDDTPAEFASITASRGAFVVSADKGEGSQIMYSTDGDTWQASSIAVGSGFALSVATYHYGFVATGVDNNRQGATTAWTSPDGRTWTMRTDWHLPANTTAVFGMGYSLVATANTAIPASSAPASSASAKPTPTPAVAIQSTTWWWSATGVAWGKSGLQTSGGDWAIAGSQILVLEAPATPTGKWNAWTSSNGSTWQRPPSGAVNFAGSTTCVIAARDTSILIVSWDSPGVLKDYFGTFAGE